MDLFGKITVLSLEQATVLPPHVPTCHGRMPCDPLVAGGPHCAKDAKSGFELTLAPAPYNTAYLEANERTLSFPPRFGEHNEAILGGVLGLTAKERASLKTEGVI